MLLRMPDLLDPTYVAVAVFAFVGVVLLLVRPTGLFSGAITPAHADDQALQQRVQVTREQVRGLLAKPETCKVMCEEMMKDRNAKKMMCEMMAKDPFGSIRHDGCYRRTRLRRTHAGAQLAW